MSRLDEITGSNEYQRQSWRDNYNGGRAAGDVTGNVNSRLDSERERYQGTTEGGSSSQPSGLELAQMIGYAQAGGYKVALGGAGPGRLQGQVVIVGTAGPGAGGVINGKPSDVKGSVSSPGSGNPAKPGEMPEITQIMVGGKWLTLDQFTSNGEDGEERWGDVGGSIYGLGVMGLDGWAMASTFVRENSKRGQDLINKKEKGKKISDPDPFKGPTDTPWEMLGNFARAVDGAAAESLRYHTNSLDRWMWGDSGGGW